MEQTGRLRITAQELKTNPDYLELKETALNGELMRMPIALSAIKILSANQILMDGKTINITERAFADLCKICKVPQTFLNTFSKATVKQIGEEVKINTKLLSLMKSAISAQKDVAVDLIASKAVSKVIAIGNGISSLSMKGFFELFEENIDKYGLVLTDMSIDHLGTVALKCVSEQTHILPGVPLSHDESEDYQGGVAFVNDAYKGTMVVPFQIRLICTNGMIGMKDLAGIKISSLSEQSLEDFYEKMNVLASNGFASMNYHQQVLKAINTAASFAEVELIWDTIRNYTSPEKVSDYALSDYVNFPLLCDKYKAIGIDVTKWSETQKKNANINISLWNIINGLTDFATHVIPGIEVDDYARTRMQIIAGTILHKKTFDTQNLVPSL